MPPGLLRFLLPAAEVAARASPPLPSCSRSCAPRLVFNLRSHTTPASPVPAGDGVGGHRHRRHAAALLTAPCCCCYCRRLCFQMTVAEATGIADTALEHTVRCILQAVQVGTGLRGFIGGWLLRGAPFASSCRLSSWQACVILFSRVAVAAPWAGCGGVRTALPPSPPTLNHSAAASSSHTTSPTLSSCSEAQEVLNTQSRTSHLSPFCPSVPHTTSPIPCFLPAHPCHAPPLPCFLLPTHRPRRSSRAAGVR